MARSRELWSTDMVDRLHALTRDGVSATNAAKQISWEFGVNLTRNAVLGRLFRDRKAGADLPEPGPRGPVPKSKPPKPKFVKNRWRKDDEKWLNAMAMRRRGSNWGFVAEFVKVPVGQLKERLREIAWADIAEGGLAQDWDHVLG